MLLLAARRRGAVNGVGETLFGGRLSEGTQDLGQAPAWCDCGMASDGAIRRRVNRVLAQQVRAAYVTEDGSRPS